MLKAKRTINIIIVFILILVAVAIVFLLNKSEVDDKNKLKVTVYYLDSLQNRLVPEEHLIENGTTEERVVKLISLFTSNPKNTNLVKTIPNDVDFIKNVRLVANKNRLEFDFSSGYYDMSIQDEIFFRSALVWTVTSLEDIDEVQIYVDEQGIVSSNNRYIGILSRENVVLSPTISPDKIDFQEVKLYFADLKNMGLEVEERTIQVRRITPVNRDQELAKYLVEELVLGPSTEGLSATIPSETKINEVVLDRNICYVNLSKEFISKHVDDEFIQKLTIYSIVNTLTSLDSVSKVQFLIESEKIENFKGGYDLSNPIDPLESLVIVN